MIITRRYLTYGIIILLLLILLLFKYLYTNGDRPQIEIESTVDLSLERYVVFADNSADPLSVKDIFSGPGGERITEQHSYKASRAATSVAINKPVQAKKPEPATNEIVQYPVVQDGEFERLKLLGIVFRDNKKKAYFALDRQRVIADVGDLVYGRYHLSDIAVNSAVLVDTKDNQQKTIMVSGK